MRSPFILYISSILYIAAGFILALGFEFTQVVCLIAATLLSEIGDIIRENQGVAE